MDIQDSRKIIDEIDNNIIDLFKKRMAAAKEIAEYKAKNNMQTLDGARERQLLARISELAGPELEGYARMIYSLMMDVSKSYQHNIVHPTSSFVDKIDRAIEETDKVFPKDSVVACQGVEGSYGGIAASKIFRFPDIRFYSQFEDVFLAVENGEAEYGVLPIENSTAGSVKMTYDLMSKHDFHIVRSLRLKVDHNLLAKKGTKKEDIKEIFSHEQAINQCAGFLKSLGNVKVTVVANTAVAAKMVSESERADVAAISSSSCASLYGLDILGSSVQDNGNNYTRFICFSKKLKIYPGADRTSIIVVLEHKPGSLFKFMSRLYALGINVTKIESRPIPDRNFEFMFYFDIEESVYSEQFKTFLSELEFNSDSFKYLGTYSEIV